MLKRIIALALAIGLASCALPANVVVLIPDEDGTVGSIVVAKGDKQEQLSTAYAALGTGSGFRNGSVFVTDQSTVDAAFSGTLAATPRPPQVFTINFVLGEAEVTPGSVARLTAAIDAALATQHADIAVVGHSDAIGDDSVNLALSLRRATAIRDALVKGGVDPAAIEIAYHGSSNPLVPAPRGVPEPRNRRVSVTIR